MLKINRKIKSKLPEEIILFRNALFYHEYHIDSLKGKPPKVFSHIKRTLDGRYITSKRKEVGLYRYFLEDGEYKGIRSMDYWEYDWFWGEPIRKIYERIEEGEEICPGFLATIVNFPFRVREEGKTWEDEPLLWQCYCLENNKEAPSLIKFDPAEKTITLYQLDTKDLEKRKECFPSLAATANVYNLSILDVIKDRDLSYVYYLTPSIIGVVRDKNKNLIEEKNKVGYIIKKYVLQLEDLVENPIPDTKYVEFIRYEGISQGIRLSNGEIRRLDLCNGEKAKIGDKIAKVPEDYSLFKVEYLPRLNKVVGIKDDNYTFAVGDDEVERKNGTSLNKIVDFEILNLSSFSTRSASPSDLLETLVVEIDEIPNSNSEIKYVVINVKEKPKVEYEKSLLKLPEKVEKILVPSRKIKTSLEDYFLLNESLNEEK